MALREEIFAASYTTLCLILPVPKVLCCEEYDTDSDFGKRDRRDSRLSLKFVINRIKVAWGPVCVQQVWYFPMKLAIHVTRQIFFNFIVLSKV